MTVFFYFSLFFCWLAIPYIRQKIKASSNYCYWSVVKVTDILLDIYLQIFFIIVYYFYYIWTSAIEEMVKNYRQN